MKVIIINTFIYFKLLNQYLVKIKHNYKQLKSTMETQNNILKKDNNAQSMNNTELICNNKFLQMVYMFKLHLQVKY